MDLILEVAEKKKCWRAAATYLKMVDYDGSFLPMTSAVRDRWEKTYGRYVDNWEKLEKQQAAKAKRAEKAEKAEKNAGSEKPEPTERVVSSPMEAETAVVIQEVAVQPEIIVENLESKIIDNHEVVNETPAPSDENNGFIRLRVNVAPIDRIREAVKNPVHEAPVPGPSEAEIEALAAERARQAREDKLNAAIPGRKFRKQGKVKPGALTPRLSTTTCNARGQASTPPNARPSNQKPPAMSPTAASPGKGIPQKHLDNQEHTSKSENTSGKDPP
jgi:hypothetical protein